MIAEDLRQLRAHTQRALAAAHQVDQRLETPATARIIAAARVFVGEVETVIEAQQAVSTATSPALPTAAPEPSEPPLGPGDEVEYEVATGYWRRVTIKSEHTCLGERAFACEWRGGYVELLESKVHRP